VESSGNAIAALITIIIISIFMALALRRVAVKEVEILRQDVNTEAPS
jgi:CPA2 family monovalent cation:H+ antiporter-2